jgi:hypothetical protein
LKELPSATSSISRPNIPLDEAMAGGWQEHEPKGPQDVSLWGPSMFEVGYIRRFLEIKTTVAPTALPDRSSSMKQIRDAGG